jgi:hypothetical protein
VKEISKKFAASTTVHGLNRVVKANRTLVKIVWALMALVSLSYIKPDTWNHQVLS